MTPVLLGRWETRLAMIATWGVLITLIFALLYTPDPGRRQTNSFTEEFFAVLAAVLVLGWAWDILWILLQKLRWDRDWPPAFAWATGIIEGALVWILLTNGWIPTVSEAEAPPFGAFFAHYTIIYFVTFFFTQSFMRALFPHWRYLGGRLV